MGSSLCSEQVLISFLPKISFSSLNYLITGIKQATYVIKRELLKVQMFVGTFKMSNVKSSIKRSHSF